MRSSRTPPASFSMQVYRALPGCRSLPTSFASKRGERHGRERREDRPHTCARHRTRRRHDGRHGARRSASCIERACPSRRNRRGGRPVPGEARNSGVLRPILSRRRTKKKAAGTVVPAAPLSCDLRDQALGRLPSRRRTPRWLGHVSHLSIALQSPRGRLGRTSLSCRAPAVCRSFA